MTLPFARPRRAAIVPAVPNVSLPEGIGCRLTDAYSPLYDPDSVWNYEVRRERRSCCTADVSVNVAAYQHRLEGRAAGFRD